MISPFVVEGAVMAVRATPAPVTRAAYADLFADRLPFIDETLERMYFGSCRGGKTNAIISSYLTDTNDWFLLGGEKGAVRITPEAYLSKPG